MQIRAYLNDHFPGTARLVRLKGHSPRARVDSSQSEVVASTSDRVEFTKSKAHTLLDLFRLRRSGRYFSKTNNVSDSPTGNSLIVSPKPASNHFRFMDLPGEIRNSIYALANRDPIDETHLQLLSRQVNSESKALYFRPRSKDSFLASISSNRQTTGYDLSFLTGEEQITKTDLEALLSAKPIHYVQFNARDIQKPAFFRMCTATVKAHIDSSSQKSNPTAVALKTALVRQFPFKFNKAETDANQHHMESVLDDNDAYDQNLKNELKTRISEFAEFYSPGFDPKSYIKNHAVGNVSLGGTHTMPHAFVAELLCTSIGLSETKISEILERSFRHPSPHMQRIALESINPNVGHQSTRQNLRYIGIQSASSDVPIAFIVRLMLRTTGRLGENTANSERSGFLRNLMGEFPHPNIFPIIKEVNTARFILDAEYRGNVAARVRTAQGDTNG
jgi:hypothetical protein